MNFRDLFRRSAKPVLSFELFPPKTAKAMEQLEEKLPRLLALEPSFFSVTYGAMGSTQERTLEIARMLTAVHGRVVAHHLTCVGASEGEIGETLDRIRESGIQNLVALRGDPPSGAEAFVAPEGGFAHADGLVRLIRRRHPEMGIAVAGYPEMHVEASSPEDDLAHLRTKVDAGADIVITQLFYDNASYFAFVEACRRAGITCPIVPGLMPIRDSSQIRRITGMCGASIPEDLGRALDDAAGDAARVAEISIEHTARQARDLIERGAPGIHFYVLNQDSQISEIMARLEPVLGDER